MGALSVSMKGWSKKRSTGTARRARGCRTFGRALASAILAAAGLAMGATAAGASVPASPPALPAPPFAHACGAPRAGDAACTAIRLLTPARNWHAHGGAATLAKHVTGGGGGSGSVPAPPSSGYYPADLQSAYGLTGVASMTTGKSAPTVAIVDAYNDPTAATDLAAYRASLSKATDTTTGLTDAKIPPLCSSTVKSTCVTFTKVNQSGGTSYPRSTAGWSEEISVDLDMVSAICPDCNIVLVEASSASLTNLARAVAYAKSLHPAAVANSYGASEFSSETTDNSTYSATPSSSTTHGTAVTAATGDSGYGAEFPAASPDLTAVGGTSLTFSGTGSSLVWNPQTVWSTAGAGCSAYEPVPSWQKVTGVYRTKAICSGRQIGDVSAVANPYTGVAVYDTYHGTGWMVFGGTSVATQIIGATYGLAAGTGTLQPTPSSLYPDKATTSAKGATPGLTPVTSGSDATCGNYLCNATHHLSSGYSGPAGLGTPDGVSAFQTAAATSGSLSFTPTSATLTAGGTTGALDVHLSATAQSTGLTVTLSTTSSGGGFSTSANGTFTSSLTVSVAGTGTASQSFYYHDTLAGTATLSATATGWSTGTMSVTVNPGPLSTLTISPSTASVGEGGTVTFTATGHDQYGNVVTVDPTWSVSASLGTFSPTTGASTTFTASSTTSGTGTVTATTGGVSATASVTVSALKPLTVTVTAGTAVKKGPRYHVALSVDATSSGAAVSGATVTLDVYSGSCTAKGSLAATGTGTTGTKGTAGFTFSARSQSTWCAVATVTKSGYTTGSGTTTFAT